MFFSKKLYHKLSLNFEISTRKIQIIFYDEKYLKKKDSRGISYFRYIFGNHWNSNRPPYIAQNIAKTCQKYFQSFITIETLPPHFCQLLQNISLQN